MNWWGVMRQYKWLVVAMHFHHINSQEETTINNQHSWEFDWPIIVWSKPHANHLFLPVAVIWPKSTGPSETPVVAYILVSYKHTYGTHTYLWTSYKHVNIGSKGRTSYADVRSMCIYFCATTFIIILSVFVKRSVTMTPCCSSAVPNHDHPSPSAYVSHQWDSGAWRWSKPRNRKLFSWRIVH